MKSYGIICELNPMHNGHAALIRQAREDGAAYVVCVMSGNAVQRGEIAVTDRHTRAKMALACGADLVLELPYPWSASGAESFARAGVWIASAFCDTLFFGSECGDLSALRQAAQICSSDAFGEAYENAVARGMGCAAAHRAVLEQMAGILPGANDTLGIAYLQAIRSLGVSLTPKTVKRLGDGYHQTLPTSSFASATALRQMLKQEGVSSLSPYAPSCVVSLLQEAEREGRMTDGKRLESAALAYFRLQDANDFSEIAEAEGGIARRICRAAMQSADGAAWFDAVRTKRYTDARLRRAMLFCMTGVTVADIRALPSFTYLLAANAKGRQLLAQRRREGGLAVLAKSADIPENDAAQRQDLLARRLDALFTLATEKPQAASASLLRAPWMPKE